MTHKWEDVRGERTPEEQARVEHYRRLMDLEGQLAQFRERVGLSQRAVAERLGVSQVNVSRIEHEEDLQLSTLARYVDALGGRLELRAVFDDDEITIGGPVATDGSSSAAR